MKILMSMLMVSMFAVSASASETVEGAKKDYETAKAEVSSQMKALDRKIDELKASAAKKSTAAKEATLKEAEDSRAKLRAEYESMKSATESNWKSFKTKLGKTLDRLNSKAQDALKE